MNFLVLEEKLNIKIRIIFIQRVAIAQNAKENLQYLAQYTQDICIKKHLFNN